MAALDDMAALDEGDRPCLSKLLEFMADEDAPDLLRVD